MLIWQDIKPSNLLLNTKGKIKIADFGVSGQLAHTLSQAVTWVGTVTYIFGFILESFYYSVTALRHVP